MTRAQVEDEAAVYEAAARKADYLARKSPTKALAQDYIAEARRWRALAQRLQVTN